MSKNFISPFLISFGLICLVFYVYRCNNLVPLPMVAQTLNPPLPLVAQTLTPPPPDGVIKPWNFSSVFKIPGEVCNPIPIVHTFNTIPGYTQCVRRQRDVVSDHIKMYRRWPGCDGLMELYKKSENTLFLDVGANMGTCSFLLLAAGARVIAFEPLPSNIFYFHETIATYNPKWKDRLVLWPVALGSTRKEETIYTEAGNAGNSALQFPTRAQRSNRRIIQVVPLDDLLWSEPPPHIALMKMDAQGYEINVLEGAKKLLGAGAIKIIQTEIAAEWLTNLGKKPSQLCQILWDADYDLFEDHCVGTEKKNALKGRKVTMEKCKEWDTRNTECDVVAKLKV